MVIDTTLKERLLKMIDDKVITPASSNDDMQDVLDWLTELSSAIDKRYEVLHRNLFENLQHAFDKSQGRKDH